MSNLSCAPGKQALSCILAIGVFLGLTGCARHATVPPPTVAAPWISAPQPEGPDQAALARTQIDEILRTAAAVSSRPFEGEGWQGLLSGRNLEGWRITPFAGPGEVECRHGLVVLGMGNPFTGVCFTNEVPRMNYEVALDAMRVMGTDFFCGLTVPVGETFCSLIVGGWGGAITGISSLDGLDASENETMKFIKYEPQRWYRVRLRVTSHRLEAWIDENKIINVDTTGKRIGLRPGDIELSKPFGLCSWQTSGAFRQLKMRPVSGRRARDEILSWPA